MGIHYFYNFCISDIDRADLRGDILSALRKRYFDGFVRIRDRITVGSEDEPLFYDYAIEKDKLLRWTVKNATGTILQEVIPAGEGKYFLYFYRDQKLYKRLLFSRLHTLLKAEYTDDDGVVCASIEPRKVQGGLCLLYESKELKEPLVLSPAPDVSDPILSERMRERFTDYSAVASTNEGIVYFLSDQQTSSFKALLGEVQAELNSEGEESFIDDMPLFEKINAKDFNVKRNLSASLDISHAAVFGAPVEEAEAPVVEPEPVSESGNVAEPEPVPEISADEETVPEEEEIEETEDKKTAEPDKMIMADGAMYSYFGDLDDNGNRSGYGRTMTDLDKVAYVGNYVNDKRSGKGAYFYKDGSLCYSGDWTQNARHGIGIGVSARDGSMHMGSWKNNKPEGNGVRMTADGKILFVCKVLEDGKTVLMHYLPDETVLVTKYDREGKKISEKTVSLLDF